MSKKFPIALINLAIALLEQTSCYLLDLQDTAELGHIARYITAAPL